MTDDIFALAMRPQDNVAVMVKPGSAGHNCRIMGSDRSDALVLKADIPMSHKVALCDMSIGTQVLKFGQPIGLVIQNVQQGDHVHVHNIQGVRDNLRGHPHA